MVKKRNKAEEIFLIGTMAVMVILIFGQVLGRYVLGSSLSWTEEVSRYVHVFQVWIGAGYAVKLREHIKIESFVDLFKGTIRKVIDIIALIIWFGLALFLAYFGTMLVLDSFNSSQVSPAVQVPIWIPYMAVPLGGLSMCIRLVQQIIDIIKFDEDEINEVKN